MTGDATTVDVESNDDGDTHEAAPVTIATLFWRRRRADIAVLELEL